MRKIWRIFAMEWGSMLQYRADMFLWIIAEAMVPVVAMAIWYNVAKVNGQGLTSQDVLTYYILLIFIRIIVTAWGGFFLAGEILRGEIAPYLVRPLSIFWKYIANNIVEKAIKLLLPLPIFLVILLLFPHLFSSTIYSWPHVLLFLLTITLAAILSFILDIVLGVIAFWIEDANEIRRYKEVLYEIASGILIPFAFFPPFFVTLFNFLPFRYMVSLPAEILLGKIEGHAALSMIGYQVLWIIGFLLLLYIMWKAGLKRYAVPGQ